MLNLRMETQENRLKPKITVIGVGGAGGNAVNNMITSNLEGCEFLVCNTDAQALEGSVSSQKIQLGVGVTRGLGAGANPQVGGAAAEESIHDIMGHLEGSNMVFVTAGMGGGTGTGAAPVIAQAAREQGILTVGVVTKPFHFEGSNRMKLAEAGIEEMQKYVDTLIIIPNQNLFRIANEKTTFSDAFCMADEVLQSGVRGVTDLMIMPGLINLDFADIRSVMAEMGKAMMGTGEAEGDRRAVEAAEAAISNPLLDDVSMKGARGVLINITGGSDMTLFEVDEAANRIRDEVDPNANIIFGSTFDENTNGKMRVSVVATGIEASDIKQPAPLATFVNNARNEANKTEGNLQNAARVTTATPTTNTAGGYSSAARSSGGSSSTTTMAPSIPSSIIPASAQPAFQPMASASPAETSAPEASTMETGFASATDYGSAATAAAQHIEEADLDASATHTKPLQTMATAKRPTAPAVQPRAQRHGNSFIPPKPVDPAFADTGLENGMITDESSLMAPKKDDAMTAAPTAPKKAPSFFERLTGQSRQDIPTAPAKNNISDQSLRVEEGGKTSGDDDDDLDIPAFLRRQAN